MDRKFLEDLGLEKETIDKVLNQNGAELTAVKTQLRTKETEVSTLRTDLTAANAKIAELEQADAQSLQKALDAEKEGRRKDRQKWNLTAALSSAGCKDVDYLLYKLGDTVEFEQDGSIKDKDQLLETVKQNYAAQFAQSEPQGTGSQGNFRRNHGESEVTQEEFDKMGYQARLRLYRQDSEAYGKLSGRKELL